jgi:hypothetical protein
MRRLGVGVIAAAVMLMAGMADPATAAAAEDCMCDFGSHQQLADAGGTVAQEWTILDLKKSTDPVPGYPLAGQLWEATASVRAVSGTITPIIPNFRALSADVHSYPVLWQLATPQGLPGSTMAQGQTSTGKIYFDATGPDPVMVTYTDGGEKPLMWCSCATMMAMPMGTMMAMPTA